MTLLEVLIVVSLIAMIALALYHSLTNGLRIWDKSRQLVVEEDVAIFFDKIRHDLDNTFWYSKIKFEGTEERCSFPTIVHVALDAERMSYQDQLGNVEYYFDGLAKKIYRRQASYGEALNGEFGPPQILAKDISRVKFQYIYLTEDEAKYSEQVLEVMPAAIDIEVEFSDRDGRRSFHKVIDIPIGSK